MTTMNNDSCCTSHWVTAHACSPDPLKPVHSQLSCMLTQKLTFFRLLVQLFLHGRRCLRLCLKSLKATSSYIPCLLPCQCPYIMPIHKDTLFCALLQITPVSPAQSTSALPVNCSSSACRLICASANFEDLQLCDNSQVGFCRSFSCFYSVSASPAADPALPATGLRYFRLCLLLCSFWLPNQQRHQP